MQSAATFPTLYQINTRIWINEASRGLGRRATLDDFPDSELDRLVALGIDWIWFLGVWQTGFAGRAVSRSHPEWRREFQSILPDLTEADICGSPFAIQAYEVSTDYGGDAALARLRARMRQRGLKLMLDFVPNHSALDHEWVAAHPEYFILGTDEHLAREPENFQKLLTRGGLRVFAHGRDPNFPGWPDTLQLNYRAPALRQSMTEQLERIAGRCDGVRCDMAMLLLPEVIHRTWGDLSRPADGAAADDTSFWRAAIARIRGRFPGFTFMAEVYWDLEWLLQQEGFDYTYDKRLYDRLRALDARGVRGHLGADAEFQRRSVRFLENHDEPRAAAAFPLEIHEAAAVISFFVPGMRFFHEGQWDGRRARVSMHLARRPIEPVDSRTHAFYLRLLAAMKESAFRAGQWRSLDCREAWPGNPTHDRFLAFEGTGGSHTLELVTVNYGSTRGQCRVTIPCDALRGRRWLLRDRLSSERHERDGTELCNAGLFLDLPAWGYHAFEFIPT
jgi:Alpha amylase, catalytic domain